jgi:hypothetical protein
MTDEELTARLRDMNGGWASDEALAAADRIEKLVERNKELALQLLATQGQAAEAAEAKLEKAVDMMLSLAAMIQHAIGPGKDVFIEPDTGRKLSDAYAIIAELIGDSHE